MILQRKLRNKIRHIERGKESNDNHKYFIILVNVNYSCETPQVGDNEPIFLLYITVRVIIRISTYFTFFAFPRNLRVMTASQVLGDRKRRKIYLLSEPPTLLNTTKIK